VLGSYKYPVPATKNFFLPSEETATDPRSQYCEDLVEAMITGLDGYFRKTKAFDRIGIAASGGKDSILTLLIAYLYAKRRGAAKEELRDFIRCFSMPTKHNTAMTQSITKRLCDELGVTLVEVPIEDEYHRSVALATSMLMPGEELTPIGHQNIQARIRGKLMWDWSNSTARGMWLQTGNMSEKAVGYTTIGGDMMGTFSLIGNLPKTVETVILQYLNETTFHSAALDDLIASLASAELSANQEDERDLMPFSVLDACYALFAGEKMMPREVYLVLRDMWTDEEFCAMYPGYKTGMLKEWVLQFVRLFRASIFKWVQAPQSIHLGALDLDRERALQLPVVQSPDWLLLDFLTE
jgi:NAD+ synthase (glutamine-hydrolysing)